MTTQEAKKIDLKKYLFSLGFEPQNVKQNTFWYCSPFRKEKTPSFKIQENVWHDFGSGEGGTIIDFGVKYFQCSISDFLKRLRETSMIDTFTFSSFSKSETYLGLIVQKVKPLQNKALLEYLSWRNINLEIAQKYCQEMYYKTNNKRYFGVCFCNDKGGYEIRNKYFKGSSSPKYYTHLKYSTASLLVVEGFMDFLSLLTLNQIRGNPPFDVLVLNSLSFAKYISKFLPNYSSVQLLLDTDDAGRQITQEIIKNDPTKIKDISQFLGTKKDVNDYLMNHYGQKSHQIALSTGRP
jgi:hypothetical protein